MKPTIHLPEHPFQCLRYREFVLPVLVTCVFNESRFMQHPLNSPLDQLARACFGTPCRSNFLGKTLLGARTRVPDSVSRPFACPDPLSSSAIANTGEPAFNVPRSCRFSASGDLTSGLRVFSWNCKNSWYFARGYPPHKVFVSTAFEMQEEANNKLLDQYTAFYNLPMKRTVRLQTDLRQTWML
jgi:hypothetical protein